MKNVIVVLFMFISSISVAQQAQKTLLKTFPLNGQEQVVLNLDGDVHIERWNNPTVRVQMEITYHNANVNIMKYLISKGRYNLTTEGTADGLAITNPNTGKNVQISKEGKILKETIAYKVFLPENVSFIVAEKSQASVVSNDGEIATQ